MATIVGYHQITDQDHWLHQSFGARGGSGSSRFAVQAPEQKAFVAWLETHGQRRVSGPST